MLKEVYRVLKPRGTFICISYGGGERRLTHLKHLDFDWEIRIEKVVKMRQAPGDGDTVTEELAEPEYQFIYICVKRGSDPLVEVYDNQQGAGEEEGEEEEGDGGED